MKSKDEDIIQRKLLQGNESQYCSMTKQNHSKSVTHLNLQSSSTSNRVNYGTTTSQKQFNQLLKQDCYFLQLELDKIEQQYQKELQQIKVVQKQNSGFKCRIKMMVKRLAQMQKSKQKIEEGHRLQIGQLLEKIKKETKRVKSTKSQEKMAKLQNEMLILKERLKEKDKEDQQKICQQLQNLEKIEIERNNIQLEIDASCRVETMLVHLHTNSVNMPIIMETSIYSEEASLAKSLLKVSTD